MEVPETFAYDNLIDLETWHRILESDGAGRAFQQVEYNTQGRHAEDYDEDIYNNNDDYDLSDSGESITTTYEIEPDTTQNCGHRHRVQPKGITHGFALI